MIKRVPFFLAIALLAAVPQDAPVADPVIAKIIKEGRENSRVMDHLDHLTNTIGPRLSGSDNLTEACEWARNQFAGWGLNARIEEWGTWPVGFNRHGWSGRMAGACVRVCDRRTGGAHGRGVNAPSTNPAGCYPVQDAWELSNPEARSSTRASRRRGDCRAVCFQDDPRRQHRDHCVRGAHHRRRGVDHAGQETRSRR